MGKGILFIVAAGLMAGTLLLNQSQRAAVEGDKVQSEQQAKTLAREIARSAYNTASSKARDLDENQDMRPSEIADSLGTKENPTDGGYQSGHFEYWVDVIEGSSYRIGAKGAHSGVVYDITGARTLHDLLYVKEFCEDGCDLSVAFEQSQAGYCSAIYLQRTLFDGSGEKLETQPDPELIFAPGNDRNYEVAEFPGIVNGTTQMNFIMAVDADSKCEANPSDEDYDAATYPDGGASLTHEDPFFEHHRFALEEGSEDLSLLVEADWAITEEDPSNPEDLRRWRIAFEDLPDSEFSSAQLFDIKKNGYPDRDENGVSDAPSDAQWDGETYGGTGEWIYDVFDEQGFFTDELLLKDYSNIPDFSDQVFIVQLCQSGGTCADLNPPS